MRLSQFIAQKTYSSLKGSFTKQILRLAVAATAISIAVLIISSSVIQGFQKEIAQKIFGFWGHMHISDIRVNRSIEPIPMVLDSGILREIADLTASNAGLSGDQNLVKHIQSFAICPGIISHEEQLEGLFLKGIGKDFAWSYLDNFLIKGSRIAITDTMPSRDIILSEQTAKLLKVDTGQSVIMHFVIENEHLKRKFHVSGIYKSGLEEYDIKFAFVDMKVIQQLLKWKSNEVSGFEVFVTDINQLNTVSNHIYENMLPDALYSETIREKFPNIFEWLNLQEVNRIVILSLILLVALINMATCMLILIMERVYMIGILRSLGMEINAIRKIFMYHAAYILIRGMFWGNVIGLGICLLQKQFGFITLNESDYYLSKAPIDLSVMTILILNALFFIAIIMLLWIPSYLVARIRPAQALRFS